MLGPAKSRRLDEPIAVSLEALVPQGHFYRHLEAKLDLGFVRGWVDDHYADRGRPSIDPVVFFKLQLVMFFEGIRSERQLIAMARLNLAHRWYLGYTLDEDLPDHSSLTRIRQRLGVDTFARFFERVVDLCQEAGLVWGRELYVDATNVHANADLDSLVPRFYHDAKSHFAGLFADDATEDEHDEDGADPPGVVLHEGVVQLPSRPLPGAEAATQSAPRWNLLEEWRLDPNRPVVGSYQRTTDFRVSPTDPDATPMRTEGRTSLGYHDHYVVDGGKARVILSALVTPADVMENVPLQDLLWRVCFRRKLRPGQVTGDTTYGTVENIVALEDAGIQAFFPLPDFDERTPFFGKGKFVYDGSVDAYRCPGGEVLPFRKHKYTERVRVYQAPAATCHACPLKTRCTDSLKGRQVKRSFDEPYVERVRGYHATEAYQKAMRKRQVWVEPLFPEAKDWHGLRRFRLRGLANVNSEGLLIAAGQNLKRFLAASGWGRRNAPCGSLVALPWEPWRLVMAFDTMADQIRTASWDPRFLAAVLTARDFSIRRGVIGTAGRRRWGLQGTADPSPGNRRSSSRAYAGFVRNRVLGSAQPSAILSPPTGQATWRYGHAGGGGSHGLLRRRSLMGTGCPIAGPRMLTSSNRGCHGAR